MKIQGIVRSDHQNAPGNDPLGWVSVVDVEIDSDGDHLSLRDQPRHELALAGLNGDDQVGLQQTFAFLLRRNRH